MGSRRSNIRTRSRGFRLTKLGVEARQVPSVHAWSFGFSDGVGDAVVSLSMLDVEGLDNLILRRIE